MHMHTLLWDLYLMIWKTKRVFTNVLLPFKSLL